MHTRNRNNSKFKQRQKNIYYPTQIYFNQFQLLKCTLVTIFKSLVNTFRTKRRRKKRIEGNHYGITVVNRVVIVCYTITSSIEELRSHTNQKSKNVKRGFLHCHYGFLYLWVSWKTFLAIWVKYWKSKICLKNKQQVFQIYGSQQKLWLFLNKYVTKYIWSLRIWTLCQGQPTHSKEKMKTKMNACHIFFVFFCWASTLL